MDDPTTEAGRAFAEDPDIDLDGYGYVLPNDWKKRIRRIEDEARAPLEKAARAVVEAYDFGTDDRDVGLAVDLLRAALRGAE